MSGGGNKLSLTGNDIYIGGRLSYLTNGARMLFYENTGIVDASALILDVLDEAGWLTEGPYGQMFYGCVNLKYAPTIETVFNGTRSSCYYMFRGCVNLETIPQLRFTSTAPYQFGSIFYNCSKIKISTTQTGEYTNAYKIPESLNATITSGVPTSGSGGSFTNMFQGTGGTFKSTPTINTIYYTSNKIV